MVPSAGLVGGCLCLVAGGAEAAAVLGVVGVEVEGEEFFAAAGPVVGFVGFALLAEDADGVSAEDCEAEADAVAFGVVGLAAIPVGLLGLLFVCGAA